MSVQAISEYTAEPRDVLANFNGQQLVYIYWQRHLMFCSPFAFLVSPDMPLGSFFDDILRPAIAAHPDSARVDLTLAQWQLNGQPFIPDPDCGMLDNGIDHKSMLTLTTPGLDGIQGSFS